MTVTDFEEYSLRLSAMFVCNMCSQFTVGNVTLPKAVLSTVKIFAVWLMKSVKGSIIEKSHSKNFSQNAPKDDDRNRASVLNTVPAPIKGAPTIQK